MATAGCSLVERNRKPQRMASQLLIGASNGARLRHHLGADKCIGPPCCQILRTCAWRSCFVRCRTAEARHLQTGPSTHGRKCRD